MPRECNNVEAAVQMKGNRKQDQLAVFAAIRKAAVVSLLNLSTPDVGPAPRWWCLGVHHPKQLLVYCWLCSLYAAAEGKFRKEVVQTTVTDTSNHI